jgi:hypothetical protein
VLLTFEWFNPGAVHAALKFASEMLLHPQITVIVGDGLLVPRLQSFDFVVVFISIHLRVRVVEEVGCERFFNLSSHVSQPEL